MGTLDQERSAPEIVITRENQFYGMLKYEKPSCLKGKNFLITIFTAMMINPLLSRATKKLILLLSHPVTTIIDRVIAINNARNFTSFLWRDVQPCLHSRLQM